MSQAAYALAVRDTIKGIMPAPWNTRDSVEVGLDGMPKPACGEWYVAVHPAGWVSNSGDYDLDEYVGLSVTVTRRLGYAPQDRWGPEVWTKTGGLEDTARRIIAVIHKKYPPMNAANLLITAGDDKFCEPLQFTGAAGVPQVKGADWFTAGIPDEQQTEQQWAQVGVALQLNFDKARRMQDANLQG